MTTNATFDLDNKELVQVAFLQFHGGDGAYLQVLIGAVLPDLFSVIYQFSHIFELFMRWAMGVGFQC